MHLWCTCGAPLVHLWCPRFKMNPPKKWLWPPPLRLDYWFIINWLLYPFSSRNHLNYSFRNISGWPTGPGNCFCWTFSTTQLLNVCKVSEVHLISFNFFLLKKHNTEWPILISCNFLTCFYWAHRNQNPIIDTYSRTPPPPQYRPSVYCQNRSHLQVPKKMLVEKLSFYFVITWPHALEELIKL